MPLSDATEELSQINLLYFPEAVQILFYENFRGNILYVILVYQL